MIYSSAPRLFRTTYVGYVWELSQQFPVILLSEKLDDDSEKALLNKKLFPHLIKIIPIVQYTGKKRTLFEAHKYFSKKAKHIINLFKPSIVIADSLINPFEKYFFRYGKRSGAHTIAFQAGAQITTLNQDKLWYQLQKRDEINMKTIAIYSEQFYQLFVDLIQHVKEIVDYWVFPVLCGVSPFFNKSLFNFEIGPAVNDVDAIVVFSRKEAETEIQRGRPMRMIHVLAHPLSRNARKIFDVTYFKGKRNYMRKNAVIMMEGNTYGHKINDLSLIPEKTYLSTRQKLIHSISTELPDWKIYIKPHPTIDDISRLKDLYESQGRNIQVVDPKSPADMYIQISSVVIGFPPPSTTLYTSVLQDPKKIVIYFDLHHELLGDAYKDNKSIQYIDTIDKFKRLLHDLKRKNYAFRKYKYNNNSKLSATNILNEIFESK